MEAGHLLPGEKKENGSSSDIAGTSTGKLSMVYLLLTQACF